VYSGGGAGGRIAVYYESSPGFEGFFASQRTRWKGGQAGEEGTIAFVRYWQNQQYLQVYQNLWFPRTPIWCTMGLYSTIRRT
jgi:hypothetical protein